MRSKRIVTHSDRVVTRKLSSEFHAAENMPPSSSIAFLVFISFAFLGCAASSPVDVATAPLLFKHVDGIDNDHVVVAASGGGVRVGSRRLLLGTTADGNSSDIGVGDSAFAQALGESLFQVFDGMLSMMDLIFGPLFRIMGVDTGVFSQAKSELRDQLGLGALLNASPPPPPMYWFADALAARLAKAPAPPPIPNHR